MVDRVKVAGLTVTVLIALIFSAITVRYEFQAFEHASPPSALVEIEIATTELEVGRFLWTNRLIDLIAQGCVLFAAAVCCGTVLRGEGKKK